MSTIGAKPAGSSISAFRISSLQVTHKWYFRISFSLISGKKKKVAKEAPPVEEKNEESESEDAEPPAITYLLAWKEDKKKWKFKKLRQTWLLQNMYNKNKVLAEI